MDSAAKKIFILGLVIFSGIIFYCLYKTLGWQIYWDTPPIHYTAWRLLQGDRLYADIHDVNWPGSHLVHMLAITIFGRSDLGFRLFDICWIGFIWLAIVKLFKGRDLGACAAAVSFLAYYLAGGEEHMQQREIQILPFIIFSLHFLCLSLEHPKKHLYQFYSGIFLGAAVFIKPFPIILPALYLPLIIFFGKNRGIIPALQFYIRMGAGFLVPAVPIMLWLWKMGAVHDFLELVYAVHYKLYGHLFNSSAKTIWTRLFLWTLPCLPVFLSVFITKKRDIRFFALLIGVCYGLIHYFAQKKGWGQHIYIAGSFMIMIGFYQANLLSGSEKKRRNIFLGLGLLTFILLSPAYYLHMDRLARNDMFYVKSAMADLKEIMRPGDEVQPVENMKGLANAMYRLDLPIPARFLHDYIFFYKTGDEDADRYLNSLKEDFISKLRGKKVRIIIIDNDSLGGLPKFPEFANLLNEDYQVYKSGSLYSIYIRRED